MSQLYIGLLSGTSMDAIDGALVDFSTRPPALISTHSSTINNTLRTKLRKLCFPGDNEINAMGGLNRELGQLFADTTHALLAKTAISHADVTAIGSHGQTIRHAPTHSPAFTLQIGDANTIAAETNITTVADFRGRDIALGGQGAPLTPAFHEYLFRNNMRDCIVVNIGGFANISFLPKDPRKPITGFDTGPGNSLMDAWIWQHQQARFDESGQWAAHGEIIPELLSILSQDPYFTCAPPKSTGHEYFNMDWLNAHIKTGHQAQDVQRTLLELSVISISEAVEKTSPACPVIICGGGTRNNFLMQRLQTTLIQHQVIASDEVDIPSQWLEAMAFAWLAKQTIEKKELNIADVTGARSNAIAGAIYR